MNIRGKMSELSHRIKLWWKGFLFYRVGLGQYICSSCEHPEFGIDSVPGVDIISMTVWSEGKNPCREHCWHVVQPPPSHRKFGGMKHVDYSCCHCTHGMCRSDAEMPASMRPPVPKQHVRVKRA